MQHSAKDITETVYPNHITINQQKYQLKYHFEPNHPRDGLTIAIPLPNLNLIDSSGLDWLVPGLLKEKITWSFKNLPKDIRRKCIPVKDWLEKFLEHPRQGSFKETFTRFIWKYVDPHFLMTDDYFASIPRHLKIKYEVINDQGKMIDLNEDLDLLKKENKKIVEAVVERIQFNIEQDGITSWPIDELPIKVEQTINGKRFEAYPAFVDYYNSISIEVFDNPKRAEQHHFQGLRRLIYFHFKERFKRIQKIPPDLSEVAIALSTQIPPKDLMENLCDAIVDEMIGHKTNIRKQFDYEQLINEGRNNLPRMIDYMTMHLIKIATTYKEIQKLRQSQCYIEEIEDDIEEQLEALLPPYEKPLFQYDKLQFIPKYLEALKLRIEKYPKRMDHDQECISQYNRIKNKWVEKVLGFVENELEIPKVYIDFQWKLQELRVSFFAQELKTNSPISVKRMDKEWAQILREYQ